MDQARTHPGDETAAGRLPLRWIFPAFDVARRTLWCFWLDLDGHLNRFALGSDCADSPACQSSELLQSCCSQQQES